MDFNDTPEEAAFRKEVRTWLDANATRKSDDKQSLRARNDDPELLKKAKEWQARKAAAGYARMTWPKEFGGRGASPILQVIYQQEEQNYLVPLGFFDIGLGMCIPTMMAYAGPEHLKRYVKPALHGDEVEARGSAAELDGRWRGDRDPEGAGGAGPHWLRSHEQRQQQAGSAADQVLRLRVPDRRRRGVPGPEGIESKTRGPCSGIPPAASADCEKAGADRGK